MAQIEPALKNMAHGELGSISRLNKEILLGQRAQGGNEALRPN
jgi:hypothetical protein